MDTRSSDSWFACMCVYMSSLSAYIICMCRQDKLESILLAPADYIVPMDVFVTAPRVLQYNHGH